MKKNCVFNIFLFNNDTKFNETDFEKSELIKRKLIEINDKINEYWSWIEFFYNQINIYSGHKFIDFPNDIEHDNEIKIKQSIYHSLLFQANNFFNQYNKALNKYEKFFYIYQNKQNEIIFNKFNTTNNTNNFLILC